MTAPRYDHHDDTNGTTHPYWREEPLDWPNDGSLEDWEISPEEESRRMDAYERQFGW